MLKSMVLLWLVIVSAPAFAGVINVVNAGFEDPQLTGGSRTWPTANPAGWSDLPSGQATLASGATIIHDATRARSGNQFLHFQNSNQFLNQRVIQNFSETLTLGNTYTASIWLGIRDTASVQTGSIRLLVGGTELITETLTLNGANISQRWHELVLEYTPTSQDLQLGGSLAIELLRTYQGNNPLTYSADFDDLSFSSRLTQGVPVPATLGLLILGFVALRLSRIR